MVFTDQPMVKEAANNPGDWNPRTDGGMVIILNLNEGSFIAPIETMRGRRVFFKTLPKPSRELESLHLAKGQ